MDDVKRILVVSRMTRFDRKALHYGASLAKQYGAELFVLYVMHDPFGTEGGNLPFPSLDEDYKRELTQVPQFKNKSFDNSASCSS